MAYRSEFADLPDAILIARGAATFEPDTQYGIPRQDMGEIDVGTTDDSQWQDVFSRKHYTRNLLTRVLQQQTKTIDVSFYTNKDLARFAKNLSKPVPLTQDAVAAGSFPVAGAPAYGVSLIGQTVFVGAFGIFDVVVKANNVVLVEEEDYRIIANAGEIEFLKVPAKVANAPAPITITYQAIPIDTLEYPIGTLPEIRGRLVVVQVAEDGQRAERVEFYVGFAPNGQIRYITGDSGEQSWAMQGRVYTDPSNPAFPYGRSTILPSLQEIETYALANGGLGDDAGAIEAPE